MHLHSNHVDDVAVVRRHGLLLGLPKQQLFVPAEKKFGGCR